MEHVKSSNVEPSNVEPSNVSSKEPNDVKIINNHRRLVRSQKFYDISKTSMYQEYIKNIAKHQN